MSPQLPSEVVARVADFETQVDGSLGAMASLYSTIFSSRTWTLFTPRDDAP